MSLAKHFDQKEFLQSWHKSKTGLRQKQDQIQKYVQDHTKDELAAVKAAMAKYQDKMQTVLKDKEFSKLQTEAESYGNQVNKHLESATRIFEQERKRILEDRTKNEQEKERLVEEVYRYILEKLYSREEIKAFKQNVVLMMIDR